MQRHSKNFKNKNIKANNKTGLRNVSTFKEATSQITFTFTACVWIRKYSD